VVSANRKTVFNGFRFSNPEDVDYEALPSEPAEQTVKNGCEIYGRNNTGLKPGENEMKDF
jgi:hypothetical protein